MRDSITRRRLMQAGAATAGLAAASSVWSAPALAAADDTEAERLERWVDLRKDLFGEHSFADGAHLVRLDAPQRALDAALVPVGIKLPGGEAIRTLSLVVDDNPVPLAAQFTFGPASDRGPMALKLRVNSYTNLHAVVETTDGAFFETHRFVKASGGCSAPAGLSDEEAMRGMGQMMLKVASRPEGRVADATLLIRHPNFTGLQMNEITRGYTPARYISRIEVTSGTRSVFTMSGEISVSANPVIHFTFLPEAGEEVRVVAVDTAEARWEKSFAVKLASL